MAVRTRIAPSPTGIAHLGNIYTALINFAFAKSHKGVFVLRIEDTDRERYVPGSEQVIFRSLRWLGIDYGEGPDKGGPYAPYTQSKRLPLYQEAAEKLVKKGKAYYCFCTQERLAAMRQAQQKAGRPPMYDGTCRRIPASQARARTKKERFVIRLKIPKSGSTGWKDSVRGQIRFRNQSLDDQVLIKSDGYPTYHLAVVVDDHEMKISHVIRAEEWISSTPKHILLYQAFGWKMPEYAHTPLLRNPDRTKLSKRRNPVSVIWYKEQGFLPDALVNYLALMGWSHPKEKEMFSLQEYVKQFSLDRIQTTQPIFDLEKLKWLNGRYIRGKKTEELLKLLTPFLPEGATSKLVRRILPLVQDRIHTLTEFADYADFFFVRPSIDLDLLKKQSRHPRKERQKKLTEFAGMLNTVDETAFRAPELEKRSRLLVAGNWRPKELFMSVRVAVTGKTVSPPLFDTLEILGRKESVRRIEHAAVL